MIHPRSGSHLAGHAVRSCLWLGLFALALGGRAGVEVAQSVGLPTPRLLTTFPMGGTQGATVDITISGEHLDGAEELVFSSPQVVAKRKLDANGQPVANQYSVTIAAECEPGLYEAQVMTRLGLSSSRVFAVGRLPEVVQVAGNTSVATAQELKLNSVCNAVVASRGADHYWFEARKGQRIVVDCASRGIDSKLEATVVIADHTGRDLLVERRTGVIDFTIPETGKYLIKVHELTYQGGPAFYYRLTVRELPPDVPVQRHPSTALVSSFSWPPAGLAPQAATIEVEPNDDRAQAITLPADISGSFATAADTDIFEFEAKKGEEWWIEVASERLGLPTDPSVIVQHVAGTGDNETLTDVAEFQDIASPVKVSSNGYAYDGPPYNAGSADVLGKLVIQQDGRHRLSVTDLFGGTRNDPANVYRLIIRRAEPDFAVVAWPLHMELRNGDRAALSKPLSLRGGCDRGTGSGDDSPGWIRWRDRVGPGRVARWRDRAGGSDSRWKDPGNDAGDGCRGGPPRVCHGVDRGPGEAGRREPDPDGAAGDCRVADSRFLGRDSLSPPGGTGSCFSGGCRSGTAHHHPGRGTGD